MPGINAASTPHQRALNALRLFAKFGVPGSAPGIPVGVRPVRARVAVDRVPYRHVRAITRMPHGLGSHFRLTP